MKLTMYVCCTVVISNFLERKEFYIIAIPEFARNWKIRSWKIIKRDSVDTCYKTINFISDTIFFFKR